jgi:hypothetical protein
LCLDSICLVVALRLKAKELCFVVVDEPVGGKSAGKQCIEGEELPRSKVYFQLIDVRSNIVAAYFSGLISLNESEKSSC